MTEPLSYIPSLDGVRALAVLAVLIFHARFPWLRGGFLGVSTFFTLSGFLITSLLLREWVASDGLALRGFWSRRFRRLLPAAWTTMAAIVILGMLGVWDADQLNALRGDVPAAMFNVVNWHFIFQDRSYGASFASPSPLEHFWSLAVEEQFYLVLPFLVFVLLLRGMGSSQRIRLRWFQRTLALLVVASLLVSGWLATNSTDRAYFGTDARMAEMLLGALLACFTLRRLRISGGTARALANWAGIAAMAVTVWLWHVASLTSSWMYPWGFLLSAFCTVLIILAGLQGGSLAFVLGLQPIVWLGRISYGVYLIHWPVFLLLSPARLGWGPWPLFGVRVVVTLAAATLMFYLVEEPIRRKRLLRDWSFPIAGCSVLAVLLVANFLTTGNTGPTSAIQRASQADATTTTIAPPLTRILVIGDQSAGVLAASMREAENTQVTSSVVSDCGLVVGGWVMTQSGDVEQDVRRCRTSEKQWLSAIRAEQPDIVVVVPAERDAFPRSMGGTPPWQPPGGSSTDAFLTSDLTRVLGDILETAESVGSTVIVTSKPTVIAATPPPLPALDATTDPRKRELAEVKIARVRESAPPRDEIAGLDSANQNLSALLSTVAKSFSLPAMDLHAMLDYLSGGPTSVDARVGGVQLKPGIGAGLVQWFVAEAGAAAIPPTSAPGTPSSVVSEVPPAPAPRPRRHTPAGEDPSILVVGDSVAYSLAAGLESWSKDTDRASVVNGARFGCPIARGGRYRFQMESLEFDPNCDWSKFVPKLIAGQRPEVVMLSSGIWEVVDRQLPGQSRFQRIGDPVVDKYILAEFVTAIDTLGADGATVAVVTQPHMNSGVEQGFQDLPESQPQRIDRLNELLREAANLRPEVAQVLDLEGWLTGQTGREMDLTRRPDGIHFTDAEALSIANDWLGPKLVELARKT